MNEVDRPKPPQLPTTQEDLSKLLQNNFILNLNDQVHEIFPALIENEKFRAYLYAVYDTDTIEGSLSADNVMAATIIRSFATERGNTFLASQKLATIVRAMNVVLRRYKLSRKERRDTLDGKIVPNENGGE